MKSIVMTAQNVRDFLKGGKIAVKKSSHDRPFEDGDVVFIREPWYRLRDARDGSETDRFNYASSSTAEPSCYKWASPVSMPAEAIRYYGRITFIIEAAGTVGEWEITLEVISKAEAQAAEAGLPFSTALDTEDASDYYTYAGDMSPEDHAKMCAAIDADRERLERIQDRIIWIAARRLEIKDTLARPATNPPSVNELSLEREGDVLNKEQTELTREEHDLRLSLEDAGVHTQTVEERAKERIGVIASNAPETPEPSEGGAFGN